MDFKIAETREEKKQVMMYYDNIRKEMAKFRDEIDSIAENKYNSKVLENSETKNVTINPPEQQEIVSNPPSPTNVSDDSQNFGYFEFVKNKVKRSYWGCGF